MYRRDFIRTAVVATPAAFALPNLLLASKTQVALPPGGFPDLVAVRNGEPAPMFDRAMANFGGMKRFVAKGQTVVVKPNIGWPREPRTGANTNPELVKRVVEHCVEAGAKKVYVLDHRVGPRNAFCYEKSGIGPAAKDGGAVATPGGDEKYYQTVEIAGAARLKTTKVHELVLGCDVLVNVPVLKHHMGARATIAMKNLMGVVWDRVAYHKLGLQECISDFCLFKKPQLNVVDAYRVTMANGPQRARPEDVLAKKMLLVSTDIVSADAAAVRILGATPEDAKHIVLGHQKQIGNMDLSSLKIDRIAL